MFDDLRADWGAAPPANHLATVAPANRSEFFNHYDGGAPLNLGDHAGCLARVKADQRFHMVGRGWSDIGYNGLVCQHGRAIEGRGIDFVGAHCPDHNTSGYGFQFMVGGDEVPTPEAYARMARLYADCCARSGKALAKKGHRDGFATDCPGNTIYAWVQAGMPAPTTHQEDDMPAPKDLWDYEITGPDGKFKATAGAWLAYTNDKVTKVTVQVAALSAAVKALAESKPGVDAAALLAAVQTSVDKALSDVTITLTAKATP